MEIGRNNRPELAKFLLGVQEVDRTQSKHAPLASGNHQDRIHISEHAKELQRIKTLVERPDPLREARVEQIRQSVASGNYTVDGTKVADSMIRQILLDSVL
jgi:negative regulator of flagellin synthesis FlgM